MSKTRDNIEGLIYAALELGWSKQVTKTNRGEIITLHAPPPNSSIHLPIVGGLEATPRQNVFRSWVRKVWRYADPLKKATFIGTANEPELMLELAGIEQRRTDRPAIDYSAPAPMPREHYLRPEPEEAPPTQETDEHVALAKIADIAAGPVPPAPVLPEMRVVDERPWLAHFGAKPRGGRRYPSPVVRERTWSDGHVDYVCALDGCGWDNERPLSVARHYGRAAGHPAVGREAQRRGHVIDLSYTEAMNPRGSIPTDQRVQRWATRLRKILDEVTLSGDLDADAALLAEHLVEQLPTPSSGDGEPLTAEEILDRIRTLVDRGEYLRLRSELTETCQRVGRLEEELAAANRVATEEHQRAAHAVDTMRALRELISEETETETEEGKS